MPHHLIVIKMVRHRLYSNSFGNISIVIILYRLTLTKIMKKMVNRSEDNIKDDLAIYLTNSIKFGALEHPIMGTIPITIVCRTFAEIVCCNRIF